MLVTNVKCSNCGASLRLDDNEKTTTCQFCGSVFVVDQILNSKEFEKQQAKAEAEAKKKEAEQKCFYIYPQKRKRPKKPKLPSYYGMLCVFWPIGLVVFLVLQARYAQKCNCISGILSMRDKAHIDEVYAYFSESFPDVRKEEMIRLVRQMLDNGNIIDFRFNITEKTLEKIRQKI